jgi:hypothetical protein
MRLNVHHKSMHAANTEISNQDLLVLSARLQNIFVADGREMECKEVGGDQSEQRRKRGFLTICETSPRPFHIFCSFQTSPVFLESHTALCQTVMQAGRSPKGSRTECLAWNLERL